MSPSLRGRERPDGSRSRKPRAHARRPRSGGGPRGGGAAYIDLLVRGDCEGLGAMLCLLPEAKAECMAVFSTGGES